MEQNNNQNNQAPNNDGAYTQPPVQQQAPVAPPVDNSAELAALKGEMENMRAFVEDASILINAVYQNPTLKEGVQQQIQGTYTAPTPAPAPTPTPTPTPTPQAPKIDPMINNLDLKTRDDVVKQIEAGMGYTGMNPDQKRSLRGTVEKRLNEWGTSVLTAPVNQLSSLLKDAYLLSDIGNAKEQGRVEALVSAHGNDLATLPGMGSGSTTSDDASAMTEHHESWSNKLDVSVDKVAENLKEFTETGKISYKAPEPKNIQPAQQAPSGAPIVPTFNQ